MTKIVLAGCAPLFDLAGIAQSFAALGFDVAFADAPFMQTFSECGDGEIARIDFTPTMAHDALCLPLNEYWISRCVAGQATTVGSVALAAARSKSLLYELLASTTCVPRVFTGVADALDYVRSGGKVVVKPDGLFSGYAVKVLDETNANELTRHVYNSEHVSNHALKLFDVKSAKAIICQYIAGEEYSADVFTHNSRTSLVRLCRKVQAIVHESPCTLVYQMITPSEQMMSAIELWCRVLFGESDTSFAQFDFIHTDGGRLVPIDFACRIAGGLSHLLHAYYGATGINVYARAVSAQSIDVPTVDDVRDGRFWTQFNCLPTKSGRLCKGQLPLPAGDVRILKQAGEFTPRCPTSVLSSVATVVSKHGWPVNDSVLQSLLLGEEYIASWR